MLAHVSTLAKTMVKVKLPYIYPYGKGDKQMKNTSLLCQSFKKETPNMHLMVMSPTIC
jgi:hypothetical protein